ncbi:hypothetical protein [Candidatus Tisiphia endosymbiont of Nemotelus uliginosus]|uniref:hypothetical protein n=1 Tax=Candidatus Tisiphia endosymbiont of Nemotelus uliginosus TaxID=3077926 RepID=UPI0035C8BE3D
MSKRFNIFSNDSKNWNVQQGGSDRKVGILSERTNSWHLFGTNASKQKSRVSLLKYCLIVFIKSNLAIIFITAAQASGRANFSSLEPFESWSPKKNIESDSLASLFLNDLNNTPKDHKNGNTPLPLPIAVGEQQQLAYQRAVYRLCYSVSDNNTNADSEYIVGMIKATEASIEKAADDFKREKYLRKKESKSFKIKKKGGNSKNKHKHLNKYIENLKKEVSISFNNIPSPIVPHRFYRRVKIIN